MFNNQRHLCSSVLAYGKGHIIHIIKTLHPDNIAIRLYITNTPGIMLTTPTRCSVEKLKFFCNFRDILFNKDISAVKTAI